MSLPFVSAPRPSQEGFGAEGGISGPLSNESPCAPSFPGPASKVFIVAPSPFALQNNEINGFYLPAPATITYQFRGPEVGGGHSVLHAVGVEMLEEVLGLDDVDHPLQDGVDVRCLDGLRLLLKSDWEINLMAITERLPRGGLVCHSCLAQPVSRPLPKYRRVI